jgi:hypothetical protein
MMIHGHMEQVKNSEGNELVAGRAELPLSCPLNN